jgi:hypothetical protein
MSTVSKRDANDAEMKKSILEHYTEKTDISVFSAEKRIAFLKKPRLK